MGPPVRTLADEQHRDDRARRSDAIETCPEVLDAGDGRLDRDERLVAPGQRRVRARRGGPASKVDDTLHAGGRSEEHTSELQSLMRISYAVFCLKKKTINNNDD